MFSALTRDEVLLEHLTRKYPNDEQFRADVRHYLPLRVENTLFYTRNKVLGPTNSNRDDFDPSHVLSQVSEGQNVIVFDSNKDLPNDWREMFADFDQLRKKKHRQDDVGDEGLSSDGGGTSDEVKYYF